MIEFEENATGKDHVALVLGDITQNKAILTRIHSECLTGDTLFRH